MPELQLHKTEKTSIELFNDIWSLISFWVLWKQYQTIKNGRLKIVFVLDNADYYISSIKRSFTLKWDWKNWMAHVKARFKSNRKYKGWWSKS